MCFPTACKKDSDCAQYHACLLGQCGPRECPSPDSKSFDFKKRGRDPITIGTIVEVNCKPGLIFGPGSKSTRLICRDDESGQGELVTLDGTHKGVCFHGKCSLGLCAMACLRQPMH